MKASRRSWIACRVISARSTSSAVLHAPSSASYERNRHNRTALYLDLAIFSPGLVFFRDDRALYCSNNRCSLPLLRRLRLMPLLSAITSRAILLQSYPVEDEAHARNALSRVSQDGKPAEKAPPRVSHRWTPGRPCAARSTGCSLASNRRIRHRPLRRGWRHGRKTCRTGIQKFVSKQEWLPRLGIEPVRSGGVREGILASTQR